MAGSVRPGGSPTAQRPARPGAASGRRRPWGVPLGRIGGIPIVIAPSWFLSAVIIVALAAPVVERSVQDLSRGWSVGAGVVLAVLLGLSVLAHELGHCVAARSMGLPVTEVRLYLVGGASELGRLPSTPKEEALIAAAGPGVSALLALASGLLIGSVQTHTVGWLILVEMTVANGVVAAFNLLPALPLDGGRVLRAAVWGVCRRRRAGTYAAAVGGLVVVAALLVWAGLALQDQGRMGLLQAALVAVLAVFVAVGALAEWPTRRHHDAGCRTSGIDLGHVMVPIVLLPAETTVRAAMAIAATRAVALVAADGVTLGVFNPVRGGRIASAAPDTPASAAVDPIPPEIIVVPGEDVTSVAGRLGRSMLPYVVVVDDDGRPKGIVMRSHLERAVHGSAPLGIAP